MTIRPPELAALTDQVVQVARQLDGWIDEAETAKYEELASTLRDADRALRQAIRKLEATQRIIAD
jgi:hypothetical protein